jgi:SRSO17 transposase
MSKTYTPELDPQALQRLDDYAARFHDAFGFQRPARGCPVSLRGLIHLIPEGERKRIEPLSRRVARPPELHVKDPEQALPQFVNQSPWDEQRVLGRYRAVLAETFASPEGIFVIDDTSFPTQGKPSVGVQRQYCGALGKRANCQGATSIPYVSPKGHYPPAMRLYLPDSWRNDEGRLDKAGVPEEACRRLSQPQIALELLDRVRDEGLPGQIVVADAGYGV